MKKVLFIDRDGTLIYEPEDFQIDSFEKLRFLPGVLNHLAKIASELDYVLVMVTNQDGLGTKVFPEKTFWGPHHLMMDTFRSEGVIFEDVFIDKSFAKDNLPTRKPNTGLLTKYLDTTKYDLANSFVIGDRLTDIQLAKNLGAKGILIGRSADKTDDNKLDNKALKPYIALQTDNWNDIYRFLSQPDRKAEITRNTNETKIKIALNLDGKGKSNIKTGLGFFDHMLEQLSKHSGCDLDVKVKGDLHIDEHHTIEDTAIALGEAFLKALGDKKGIQRYGFLLPMDDVLAQVAIDFSGRPWIVWKAKFTREKVGDMPTELFFHFWKSFSDAAKCNLNIKAEGDNEHHKIEAIFKAVAKSIRMAVKREGNDLPSTKGML
ncbi:MAG TPA: bifunctional histidinol-phosphatase/imidazoleglycerol-phosphate dehydratase HisB [Chitinophagales bacterium]|nr:bifunctional histidinol-phosphatase/imidazoleglycerol-phosphate dehydratase HisB [Chitinophagales bacterium]HPW85950.1 bifunctional histidinol-phosphatase/imidazoleglycerol-phosphate dehydratase HisB [Chitinophagales bacterium]HQD12237.1 bifunctional histidinol-phosphatase/imidazoleglycerol-phosphate dehydratase HisB [Chitinophagales bacterium]HQO31025.1 bifunctional histidinol-phosphatase/imidazoleglycerol-phosphate dehydratase HisB [Chitinophagales bacterium]